MHLEQNRQNKIEKRKQRWWWRRIRRIRRRTTDYLTITQSYSWCVYSANEACQVNVISIFDATLSVLVKIVNVNVSAIIMEFCFGRKREKKIWRTSRKASFKLMKSEKVNWNRLSVGCGRWFELCSLHGGQFNWWYIYTYLHIYIYISSTFQLL